MAISRKVSSSREDNQIPGKPLRGYAKYIINQKNIKENNNSKICKFGKHIQKNIYIYI